MIYWILDKFQNLVTTRSIIKINAMRPKQFNIVLKESSKK